MRRRVLDLAPDVLAVIAEGAWVAAVYAAIQAAAHGPTPLGPVTLAAAAGIGLVVARRFGPALGDRWPRTALGPTFRHLLWVLLSEGHPVPLGLGPVGHRVALGADQDPSTWGCGLRVGLIQRRRLNHGVRPVSTLWRTDRLLLLQGVRRAGRALLARGIRRSGGYGGVVAHRFNPESMKAAIYQTQGSTSKWLRQGASRGGTEWGSPARPNPPAGEATPAGPRRQQWGDGPPQSG